MKTAAEREAEFRADLKVLLDKHGADIDPTIEGWGSAIAACTVSISGIFKDGELIADYCEFNI
jgi:hypothetical protein